MRIIFMDKNGILYTQEKLDILNTKYNKNTEVVEVGWVVYNISTDAWLCAAIRRNKSPEKSYGNSGGRRISGRIQAGRRRALNQKT